MATRQAVQGQARSLPGGERLVFPGMGLAILLPVFAGFAPSWFPRGMIDSGGRPLTPLSPLILVHGAAFTAWNLLFIVQTWLVPARRPRCRG